MLFSLLVEWVSSVAKGSNIGSKEALNCASFHWNLLFIRTGINFPRNRHHRNRNRRPRSEAKPLTGIVEYLLTLVWPDDEQQTNQGQGPGKKLCWNINWNMRLAIIITISTAITIISTSSTHRHGTILCALLPMRVPDENEFQMEQVLLCGAENYRHFSS